MKKKAIKETETRPFVIRAITAEGEKVVLPQRYGTIAAANKAIETMIAKRKFVGDDNAAVERQRITGFASVEYPKPRSRSGTPPLKYDCKSHTGKHPRFIWLLLFWWGCFPILEQIKNSI
jgi:hypothetical protein